MEGQPEMTLLGELRRVAGLTQEELAERTGLTVRGISNIERGRVARPRRSSLEALARGLGLRDAQVARFVQHYVPEAPGAPSDTPPPQTVAVPAQLPAGSSAFTGREREIKELDALYAGRGQRVFVLEGMGGVGKTSLAVHWAQSVRRDFPDGQLFANLRGYGPGAPAEPGEVLHSFLRAFGVPAADVPADLDGRSALLRSVLATRSVFLLLDNARSADQVRPLLPGHAGCVVLVTTRTTLHGLAVSDDAHRVLVPPLDDDEALSLLGRLVDRGRLTDRAALADVVAGCSGLPLALRIVAERLAHDRGLAEVASAMRSAGDRLDALTTEEAATSLPAVLSWSYRALPAGVAAALRLLGRHPGPHWDSAAAAAALGTGVPEARRLLQALVAGHLLDHRADGRYEFHDLVRDYARSLDTETDPATRLARHYLAGAVVAADAVAPRDPHRRPLLTDVDGDGFAFGSADDAAAWLAVELPTLLAIAEWSAAAGDAYARDLSTVLWQALRVHGHYGALHTLHGHALAEARRDGDSVGQQQALSDLAAICARVGRYDEAIEHLTASLDVEGSVVGTARALTTLGTVYAQLGQYESAAHHLRRAVTLALEAGDTLAEGRAYGNLGFVHEHRRELDAALECYHRQLDIALAIGDRASEAISLHNLGDVYRALGRYEEAREYLVRSLGVSRAAGHREAEGYALVYLGLVHLHLGDAATGRSAEEEALAVAAATGIRPLETLAHNALGDIARATADRAAALEHYLRAREVAQLTSEQHEEARALEGIAGTYEDAGEAEKGRPYRRRAQDLYQAMGIRS
ncbi:tetratricopeptide repeat protein [Amycolatopsis sp. NEAU-NG30]|uniref:Tetratricopeptide repeat protein n=1 Tax=Amycolatopsis melonis TaxID=3156488 RepID=A0ABV0LCC0_9PSEU